MRAAGCVAAPAAVRSRDSAGRSDDKKAEADGRMAAQQSAQKTCLWLPSRTWQDPAASGTGISAVLSLSQQDERHGRGGGLHIGGRGPLSWPQQDAVLSWSEQNKAMTFDAGGGGLWSHQDKGKTFDDQGGTVSRTPRNPGDLTLLTPQILTPRNPISPPLPLIPPPLSCDEYVSSPPGWGANGGGVDKGAGEGQVASSPVASSPAANSLAKNSNRVRKDEGNASSPSSPSSPSSSFSSRAMVDSPFASSLPVSGGGGGGGGGGVGFSGRFSPAHEPQGSICSAHSGRCRNMSAGKYAQERPIIGVKETYYRGKRGLMAGAGT
jgi:hypothetical protein